jgi:hypothetical protein
MARSDPDIIERALIPGKNGLVGPGEQAVVAGVTAMHGPQGSPMRRISSSRFLVG